MAYYADGNKISLKDLQKRIKETDLVPSRSSLLEGIADNFNSLEKHGVSNLSDLRKELKNPKSLSSLSQQTGIAIGYLALLRREIEGYFPKAYPLSSFAWLPKKEIAKLESNGFKNSALLYEALAPEKARSEIVKKLGLDRELMTTVYSLTDLTRIQWTSPIFARMLIAAGYDTSKKVAEADAEELCDALDSVNKESKFFKGKIGLRDVKRLIKAAAYVPRD